MSVVDTGRIDDDVKGGRREIGGEIKRKGMKEEEKKRKGRGGKIEQVQDMKKNMDCMAESREGERHRKGERDRWR